MRKTTGIDSDHLIEILFGVWNLVSEAWDEKSNRLRGFTGLYIPDYAPLSMFTIFDDFQESVEVIPAEA